MRRLLSCAVGAWLAAPVCTAWADDADIRVEADSAKENAKYESQSTTIITAEDIAKKQAKSVEGIIFDETGMTRTVDAMGRVGLSIRGEREVRRGRHRRRRQRHHEGGIEDRGPVGKP